MLYWHGCILDIPLTVPVAPLDVNGTRFSTGSRLEAMSGGFSCGLVNVILPPSGRCFAVSPSVKRVSWWSAGASDNSLSQTPPSSAALGQLLLLT